MFFTQKWCFSTPQAPTCLQPWITQLKIFFKSYFFVFTSNKTSKKRTTSLQGTNGSSLMCPLFGGFTVLTQRSHTLHKGACAGAEFWEEHRETQQLRSWRRSQFKLQWWITFSGGDHELQRLMKLLKLTVQHLIILLLLLKPLYKTHTETQVHSEVSTKAASLPGQCQTSCHRS